MKHLSAPTLLATFALGLLTASAHADPTVYVTNLFQQFGTVSLTTGVFSPIGPGTPEAGQGLVMGLGGSLLTLTTAGNLSAINPTTGIQTVVGPTGLGDCSLSTSPCGPNSAGALTSLGGKLYATDFGNNLYTVDPLTGIATLIGATGIPPVPIIPFSMNPDGSTNLFDESLFSAGGNLYETFDVFSFATDGYTKSFAVAPGLYKIDPLTGIGSLQSAASPQILSATNIGGVIYVFQGGLDAANPFPGFQTLGTLNLATGNVTTLLNLDASTGPIFGIVEGPSPVPEPSSLALLGTGLAALAAKIRRARNR